MPRLFPFKKSFTSCLKALNALSSIRVTPLSCIDLDGEKINSVINFILSNAHTHTLQFKPQVYDGSITAPHVHVHAQSSQYYYTHNIASK